MVLTMMVLGGCATAVGDAERNARAELASVSSHYRPDGERPALPELRPDSPEVDFLRYAILNHPAVEAAFDDWRAAVAEIPVARAQPDPKLTFEADIASRLMTFMPGLMFDFMNSGTRAAMARESTAASEVAYHKYLAQIQATASEVRMAWVDVVYAEQALELHTAMLHAFDEAAETAAADYTTGRGMATLEMQVRLRNEAGMHHTRHHATAALRRAARARFKAALGIPVEAPNPPWPVAQLATTTLPEREALWQEIARANPDLALMRSMVDMAVAKVDVAERAKKPDFSLGAMVDLKANPLMVRPTGGLSLPIWREKINAGIDAARARHAAAAARVSAEELTLAAALAQKLYLVQEADEMLTYIDETALPNLDLTMSTAAAGFETGMAGATTVVETQALRLEMEGRRLDSLRARETAVAELQMLIGGAAPADI